MNNDQKRTVLAFVLTGVIVFTWQSFFSPKQEVYETSKDTPVTQSTSSDSSSKEITSSNTIATTSADAKSLSSVTLENDKASFVINNDLSIKNATGNKTSMSLRDLSDKDNFFAVRFINSANALEAFNFVFTDGGNNEVTGVDETKGVSVSLVLNEDGKLLYSLNSTNPFRVSYNMSSIEKQSDNRTYRQFTYFTQDTERVNVEDDESGDASMKWMGLDFNHHGFFNVLSEKTILKFLSTENGDMVFQTVAPATSVNGYFLYSIKNYDYLASFKDQLELSIDFGIFGIFSVPILRSMQFVYGYVGNYGVAIILLTIVIRLATYPLQAKSFKSMKKMQTLQPEIAKLKEKYADDPMKQQKETMELFKRSGASPLGGCLPMVLQIPIFIAFYQAISNSVELVGSPFYLWITDLSAKDPYYVLPAIMGVTMLLQTKLNPSTSADPNQKKIMYIMPIVFIFIMKDLPAGLNLYFTVSNILGIAQQLYVYKTADA